MKDIILQFLDFNVKKVEIIEKTDACEHTMLILNENSIPAIFLRFLGEQISPTFSYFLINSALLYHFLVDLLADNQKMTVFHKASSHEMTSQSFPVSCFWSRSFVPRQK